MLKKTALFLKDGFPKKDLLTTNRKSSGQAIYVFIGWNECKFKSCVPHSLLPQGQPTKEYQASQYFARGQVPDWQLSNPQNYPARKLSLQMINTSAMKNTAPFLPLFAGLKICR